MMRSFVFTDKNGRCYRIWPRGWYQQLTRAQYFNGQQQAADQARAKGQEKLAESIEAKTFIAWCADSGWAGKYQLIRRNHS